MLVMGGVYGSKQKPKQIFLYSKMVFVGLGSIQYFYNALLGCLNHYEAILQSNYRKITACHFPVITL